MSNFDTDKEKFESWLSAGLKKPVGAPDDFAQRVLSELDQQKARQLLNWVCLQEKVCKGTLLILILSAIGILFYSPVTSAIFAFIESAFTQLIQLVVEPTLTGLVIPIAVIAAAVGVVWNLIEMVSLE